MKKIRIIAVSSPFVHELGWENSKKIVEHSRIMTDGEFSEFRFSEQLELDDALQLGAYLTRLRNVPYEDDGFQKFYNVVQELYSVLDSSDFGKLVQNEIVDLVDAWTNEEGEFDLETYDPDNLSKFAKRWANHIQDEIRSETRLPVNQKGFFDVEKAVERPNELFASEIWESMPERTKSDIREACRSLAVKCPTAATFLALRAVEDRLRFWYEHEEGGEIEKEAWGQVLGKLENIYEDKNKPPVMTNLEFLQRKRNNVSHPDKSPDLSEAETTILRVRGTITEIYEELETDSSESDLLGDSEEISEDFNAENLKLAVESVEEFLDNRDPDGEE